MTGRERLLAAFQTESPCRAMGCRAGNLSDFTRRIPLARSIIFKRKTTSIRSGSITTTGKGFMATNLGLPSPQDAGGTYRRVLCRRLQNGFAPACPVERNWLAAPGVDTRNPYSRTFGIAHNVVPGCKVRRDVHHALWDTAKAEANRRKHGVAFPEATAVFSDTLSSTICDPDHSAPGENRELTIGLSLRRRLIVVAHCKRGSNVVVLEPDIAREFPTAESVNEALRSLMPVISSHRKAVAG